MLKKVMRFFTPTPMKLLILLMLVLLILFIKTDFRATSKVTWSANRGIPFSFLSTTSYKGPCLPEPYCERVCIEAIHPIPLLADLMFWYVIACAITIKLVRRFQLQF